MTKKDFRKKAELIAKTKFIEMAGNFDKLSSNETAKLIHELQVHQIELDMQNEELRRIGEELEASRSRYFVLYDLAPAGYVTVSKKGLILEANLTSATLWGVNKCILQGNPFTKFIFRDSQDIYYAFRKKLFETEKQQTCEIQMINKDSTIFWVRLEGVLAQDTLSKEPVCRIIINDISALKQAEKILYENQEALKKTAAGLKSSNEELKQFAHIASHDLKEPLRTISNYAQLLQKKSKEGEGLDVTLGEYINIIIEGVAKMYALIDDILSYSSLSKIMVTPKLVNINKVLKNVENNLITMINERKVKITSSALSDILGDENQILRLFQNLIENAIKFCPNKTPKIHISCKKDLKKQEFIFSIRDNGIGIDNQYFYKLFIMFNRLNSAKAFRGTGMGLAICRKIVEMHGGKISVESKVNEGSTFTFTIPFKNESSQYAKE